jgi:hypothetical protein
MSDALKALEALEAEADGAYVRYINKMREPLCLGSDYKLENGGFGAAELNAHVDARELLGYHRGMWRVLKALSALDQPSGVRVGEALDAARKAKEYLTRAADEMREKGVNGWPVACDYGAEAITNLLSALDLSVIGAGGGWKLVPVEPTPEMLAAFWRQKNVGTQTIGPIDTSTMDCSDYAAYRAMLAAAPSPPEPRS